MHIASAKSGNGQSVSWFLLDRSTADILFGFEQTKDELKLTRWASVVAVYTDNKGVKQAGIAWTSKKDEFNVGVGMKVSLDRALETLPKEARSSVWNDVVFANATATNLLRNPKAQYEWSVKTGETMERRASTLQ